MSDKQPMSPTTAVEAYLHFVLNDLSTATADMTAAANELRLAAQALEQKEMEFAIKMDEVGSRLLIDIRRRASTITEEEIKKYRQEIGVTKPGDQKPATLAQVQVQVQAGAPQAIKNNQQKKLGWFQWIKEWVMKI